MGIRLSESSEFLKAKKALDNCGHCGVSLKGYRYVTSKLCRECGKIKNRNTVRAFTAKKRETDPEYGKKKLAYQREYWARKKARAEKITTSPILPINRSAYSSRDNL